MAGKKGHSEPPGNANAFGHGLATLQHRRAIIREARETIYRYDVVKNLPKLWPPS